MQFVLVFSLLASAMSLAQAIPPASIYSIGGMQSSPPPASITAQGAPRFPVNPGPHRFVIGGGGRFDGGRPGPAHIHGRGHGRGPFAFPSYYPVYVYPFYGYPYYGPEVVYEDQSPYTGAGTFNIPTEAAPQRSFYEPRPAPSAEDDRYGDHYTDGRESLRQPSAEPPRTSEPVSPEEEEPAEPTLFIFKNGSTLEVQNYAIMGDYIFVFAGERRKIALAELDIPATTKANEDRGTDFHTPARP